MLYWLLTICVNFLSFVDHWWGWLCWLHKYIFPMAQLAWPAQRQSISDEPLPPPKDAFFLPSLIYFFFLISYLCLIFVRSVRWAWPLSGVSDDDRHWSEIFRLSMHFGGRGLALRTAQNSVLFWSPQKVGVVHDKWLLRLLPLMRVSKNAGAEKERGKRKGKRRDKLISIVNSQLPVALILSFFSALFRPLRYR